METLRPTYRLIVGTPGKSNAFAISEKLGLPGRIIERANACISRENKRLETVLGELEAARLQADRNLEQAERARKEYEAYREEAEREIADRLDKAQKELDRARDRAQNMVTSAKVSADYILEELNRLQKQRESERLGEELARARRDIREHLRTHQDAYDPVEVRKSEDYVLPRALRKGDEVLIVSLGRKAVLTEDPDRSGKVTVQAGIIKTKVAVSDLQLLENEPQVKSGGAKKKAGEYRMTVCRDFKDELHLRGLTGEEAWSKVDKYFDEAQIAGFHTVRLVHGKGTGALKKALWNYLRVDPRVASYRIGQFGEGDGGVTVVELK